MKQTLILTAILTCTACTHQWVYESVQNDAKQKCSAKPSHQEYQDCMAHHEQSYDEYKEERQQILDEEEPVPEA